MRPSSSNPSLSRLARSLGYARYVFAGLFLVTGLLLAWQHYGMDKVIDLAGPDTKLTVDGDGTSGGRSVARLERDGKDIVFRCKIVKGFEWPYCKLFLNLTNAKGEGIDMSEFSHITVDADYRGPGPLKIGMMLANAEPGLTFWDQWQTYKINQVDGIDISANNHLIVPIRWFAVAQWWKDTAKPSFEHSFTQVDNVVRVELSTPPGALEGEHVMVVHGIHLHGKLISQNTLLKCLVGVWIFCAIAWPVAAAIILRSQLRQSDAARTLLAEVNKALELEARELAGQAHIDPLTGALNRQGLRAALMNTSTLMADPMSAIFIDIDRFKPINDIHGHDIGDQVLRKFATVIASGIRSSDQLVRWGGEEFLIVCPMTRLDQAQFVAETLRRMLHQQVWPAGLHVTASFGVAQHRPGDEIGAVIKHADQQLYQAKANGRDRVHVRGMEAAAPV